MIIFICGKDVLIWGGYLRKMEPKTVVRFIR